MRYGIRDAACLQFRPADFPMNPIRSFSFNAPGAGDVNYNACFQCHKPKTELDFVFTLPQLLKFAR